MGLELTLTINVIYLCCYQTYSCLTSSQTTCDAINIDQKKKNYSTSLPIFFWIAHIIWLFRSIRGSNLFDAAIDVLFCFYFFFYFSCRRTDARNREDEAFASPDREMPQSNLNKSKKKKNVLKNGSPCVICRQNT